MQALLPLFPLELVLLPHCYVPLHIFEDRYKEMVGEALRDKTEFGIVQAAENGILNIGCTGTIQDVASEYPDGRLDIVVVGRRRFEINLLNQEKSYLRASVSFFDDEDGEAPTSGVRAAALAGFRLLLEAGQITGDVPAQSDPHLSFKLAQYLPELDIRQALLASRSETGRLKQLIEYLPGHIAKAKRNAHIRKIASTNGHGHLVNGHTEAGGNTGDQ